MNKWFISNTHFSHTNIIRYTGPVAIEIEGKPFAPVVDVQNTIRQRVNWKSGEVAFENPCDAFGKEVEYLFRLMLKTST